MNYKDDIMYVLDECHKHGDTLDKVASQIQRFFKDKKIQKVVKDCLFKAAKEFLATASGEDTLLDFTEKDYGTITLNKFYIEKFEEALDKALDNM